MTYSSTYCEEGESKSMRFKEKVEEEEYRDDLNAINV
jgi:hypothetical protein